MLTKPFGLCAILPLEQPPKAADVGLSVRPWSSGAPRVPGRDGRARGSRQPSAEGLAGALLRPFPGPPLAGRRGVRFPNPASGRGEPRVLASTSAEGVQKVRKTNNIHEMPSLLSRRRPTHARESPEPAPTRGRAKANLGD